MKRLRYFTTVIKDNKFYFVIVLPLQKSSLRKMIQERHNNRDINLMVLEKLKPIVCGQNNQHGDLKVNLEKRTTDD